MTGNMNRLKGIKFFDKDLNVIRLIKQKQDFYSCVEETKNNRINITDKELHDNYTILRPDGYVLFSILDLSNGMKDVMLVLYRKDDVTGENTIPYAVCRQFIDDVFTNMILPEGYHSIGVSISQDTCPADIDFNNTLLCNGIIRQEITAIYADDKLSDILSLVNKKPYNDVLQTIYNSQAKDKLIGLCPDLKDLLKMNNFMYDFYRGFEIHQVPYTLSSDFEGVITNPELKMYIENLVRSDLNMIYATKFSKEIDLKALNKEFLIIADMADNTFLVVFDKAETNSRSYDMISNNQRVSEAKWEKFNS